MRVGPDLEMGTPKKSKRKVKKKKKRKEDEQINYYGLNYGVRSTYIVRTSGGLLPPNGSQRTIFSGSAGDDPIREADPEYWRLKPSCWAH